MPIRDSGLEKYPENINRTGQNKGSKWRSTLLKELLEATNHNDDAAEFAEIKKSFPHFFSGSEKKSYQFFLLLKQISHAFNKKDPNLSLKAIEAIMDRVDGKPKQSLDISGEQIKPIRYIDATGSD